MKFLLSPDKFKGSMDAKTVASIMKDAILELIPNAEIKVMPLADGGEGSLQVFNHYQAYEEVIEKVKDPLSRDIEATYLWDEQKKQAIVELSQASGYERLTAEERNPMNTSTFGTGQQIRSAIDKGATSILICIGGSSTNDCGIGMASALGVNFLNKQGQIIQPIGKNLQFIKAIETQSIHPKIKEVSFHVACDVNNPLYGPNGAAFTFGKQKGANNKEILQLDDGLQNISTIIERDLGITVNLIPGSGAAGGFGAGAVAFLNANLLSGAKLILDTIDFDLHLKKCDWVFTGEGKIDHTSFQGKLLSELIEYNHQYGKQLAVFAGRINDVEHKALTNVYFNEITPRNISMHNAFENAQNYLTNSVKQFIQKTIHNRIQSVNNY